MKRVTLCKLVVISLTLSVIFTTTHAATTPSAPTPTQTEKEKKFEAFVATLQKAARKDGISEKTIQKYLTGLQAPREQALYDIKHQAQEELTFSQYVKNFVPQSSIRKGREYMQQYRDLLLAIQKKYQVQPQFILALWGAETEYGSDIGKAPMIQSLVTLAFQHHRSDFYRRQVMSGLKILDHQHIPQEAFSTWDGGMGQPSFEPYIYLNYAVDFDGDGFKNIWTSIPDVFASIANFLHKNGWNGQQTWGMEVTIPNNLSTSLVGVNKKLSIAQWQSLGVRPLQAGNLPNIQSSASLLLPDGQKGRAFLVFHNFDVLLRWNNTSKL